MPGTCLWRVLEEKISQSEVKDPFLKNSSGVCVDEVHPPCLWLTAGCSGSACTRDRGSESERDRQTDGGMGGGGMAGERERREEKEREKRA